MSDYLNNLVSRTLSLAPVVQPRLASVFERQQTTVNVKPVEGSDDIATEVRQVSRPVDVAPAHTQPQVVSINTQAEAQLETPKINTAEPLAIKPERVGPTKQIQTVETHRVEQISEVRSHPQVLTQPTVVTPERDASLAMKSHRALESSKSEPNFWESIESRVRQAVKDELPSESPLNERKFPSPVVAEPRIAEDKKKERPTTITKSARTTVIPSEPPFFASAPPEITVTIGRVDVRAVFAPAAPPVRREVVTQDSSSSLEQYLKTRSEGRR